MSANIEFSCKGCVFAEHTNGRQKGCRLGRLEKLCPEDTLAEGLESDSEEAFSFIGLRPLKGLIKCIQNLK